MARRGWTLAATLAALVLGVLVPMVIISIRALRGGDHWDLVLVMIAIGLGAIFSAMLLRRIRALVVATEALAAGDLSARVQRPRAELGALGRSFNDMAERIERQATALAAARAELEARVEERTASERAIARALRVSHARKAAVLEAALDAIVQMDHTGVITGWNPAAELLFGWPASDALGRTLGDLIVPPALRDDHERGMTRYLDTGEPHILGRRFEVPAVRRDGSEFPAEVAVVRIETDGAAAFTGYIRDISERHQAAEAEVLRASRDAAEAANAELEAFSYSVAHDLRAPLRAIQGFSTVLLEDHGERLDADGRRALGFVAQSAIEMAGLIDALLGLARLTRVELQPQGVDLSALARAAGERLRAQHPERAVELVVADGLQVRGDLPLLRVLLDNLLGNAWKFTGKVAQPRVEVGRDDQGGEAVYFVRDNGAGFDMAHANHLFMPFRRMHARNEFEGTGIGLATVHRIVRRHGGRIWAEAAVGAGATFRFTLPAQARSNPTLPPVR